MGTKKKKYVDTSKFILRIVSIYIGILTPFTIALAFMGQVEPFAIVIKGAFALAGIAVGFYYWKAKCENLHKYKQDDKIVMGERSDL